MVQAPGCSNCDLVCDELISEPLVFDMWYFVSNGEQLRIQGEASTQGQNRKCLRWSWERYIFVCQMCHYTICVQTPSNLNLMISHGTDSPITLLLAAIRLHNADSLHCLDGKVRDQSAKPEVFDSSHYQSQ